MAERVLVTGARAAAALDLARDFSAAGYEAHMADCAPARIARWSSRVAKVHAYPSPVRDPVGFRARIRDLVQRLDPVLILPACEEVFHLARAGLDDRLFQPPAETLGRLHDKGRFADLCQAAGLPVPETRPVAAPDALAGYLGEAKDWVFKARYSRFGEGVLVGPDADALARLSPGPRNPWIAQRRVRGAEVSFYAVARDGRLAAFAAYGSAWRLPGGASLTFDPVEPGLAGRIEEVAARLAAVTGLTGQFACDLMVDRAGHPWLLECNPRATSGVHLLAGEGHLARAILGAPAETLRPAGGPRQLLPAFLTFGLGEAVRTGRLKAWRAQLAAAPDVAGRPGDRWPTLGAAVDGLDFMLLGLRRRISTAAATTADIEWNGEETP